MFIIWKTVAFTSNQFIQIPGNWEKINSLKILLKLLTLAWFCYCCKWLAFSHLRFIILLLLVGIRMYTLFWKIHLLLYTQRTTMELLLSSFSIDSESQILISMTVLKTWRNFICLNAVTLGSQCYQIQALRIELNTNVSCAHNSPWIRITFCQYSFPSDIEM